MWLMWFAWTMMGGNAWAGGAAAPTEVPESPIPAPCIDLRGPGVTRTSNQPGMRFSGDRTRVDARRLRVGTQPLAPYVRPDHVESTFAAPFIAQMRIRDTVTVPSEGLGMAFSIDPDTVFAVGESGQRHLEILRHRLDTLGLDARILQVSVDRIDADEHPDLHGIVEFDDHTEQIVLWGSGGETRWKTDLFGSTVPIYTAEPVYRIPSMPGFLVTTGSCCGGFWANLVPIEPGVVETRHHMGDVQQGLCLEPDGTLRDLPAQRNAR